MLDPKKDTTDGLPNSILLRLVDRHRILRLEDRHEANLWVELSHDRLIDAVVRGNKQFLQELQKRHILLNIAMQFDLGHIEALRISPDDLAGMEMRSPQWVLDDPRVMKLKREFMNTWRIKSVKSWISRLPRGFNPNLLILVVS